MKNFWKKEYQAEGREIASVDHRLILNSELK